MNWKPLIKSLPPGLSYTEAAQRLGLQYQACRKAIQKYRYRAQDGRRFSQNSIRKLVPANINWRKSNVEIARQTGISRERVRVIRKQLGFPTVESRGRKPNGKTKVSPR